MIMPVPEHLTAVVQEMLRVAAGEKPLPVGNQIVHPQVLLHIDNHSYRVQSNWRIFIRYLSFRQQKLGLTLQFGRLLQPASQD